MCGEMPTATTHSGTAVVVAVRSTHETSVKKWSPSSLRDLKNTYSVAALEFTVGNDALKEGGGGGDFLQGFARPGYSRLPRESALCMVLLPTSKRNGVAKVLHWTLGFGLMRVDFSSTLLHPPSTLQSELTVRGLLGRDGHQDVSISEPCLKASGLRISEMVVTGLVGSSMGWELIMLQALLGYPQLIRNLPHKRPTTRAP